jgi:hypothetical protein
MGWNSYDALGDSVTKDEVLANATYVKEKFPAHGWSYIVIGFRWYDPGPIGNNHALNRKRTVYGTVGLVWVAGSAAWITKALPASSIKTVKG